MSRTRSTAKLALALLLLPVGCGGVVTAAHAPAQAVTKPTAAAAAAPAAVVLPATPAQAEAALLAKIEVTSANFARVALGVQNAGPQRPRVNPVAVKLGDLASAQIPDALPNPTVQSVGSPPGDPTNQIVLETMGQSGYGNSNVTMTVKAREALANVHVGPWAEGSTGASEGSYVQCSKYPGQNYVSPLRWETLTPNSDGSLEYAVMDGWLDRGACKASLVHRTKVTARAIVPGMLYGFHQCSGGCEQDALTLIFAATSTFVAGGLGVETDSEVSGFGRVTIPIQRGGGLSFMAEVAQSQLGAWRTALGSRVPTFTDNEIVFGLEITQDLAEREPIAIGYLSNATPSDGSAAVSSRDFDTLD